MPVVAESEVSSARTDWGAGFPMVPSTVVQAGKEFQVEIRDKESQVEMEDTQQVRRTPPVAVMEDLKLAAGTKCPPGRAAVMEDLKLAAGTKCPPGRAAVMEDLKLAAVTKCPPAREPRAVCLVPIPEMPKQVLTQTGAQSLRLRKRPHSLLILRMGSSQSPLLKTCRDPMYRSVMRLSLRVKPRPKNFRQCAKHDYPRNQIQCKGLCRNHIFFHMNCTYCIRWAIRLGCKNGLLLMRLRTPCQLMLSGKMAARRQASSTGWRRSTSLLVVMMTCERT